MSAGRNVNQNAAITVTDGNLMMCAANDVNVNAKITLTRGSSIPSESLGLPLGLTLSAGYGGTGPGTSGGTLNFSPLAPPVTVTGPNAPVTIYYNPVSYTAPTDYSTKFVLTGGAALTQYMLVFPDGASRTFDGTTATSFTSLKGSPDGVTLIRGPGATANFDNADVGVNKGITFSGYSLGGPNASKFAFATSCCSPVTQRTTGEITQFTRSTSGTIVTPKVLLPLVAAPIVTASLEAPASMYFAEAPPETVAEALPEEVPPPYVAPVRPRKQGRQ